MSDNDGITIDVEEDDEFREEERADALPPPATTSSASTTVNTTTASSSPWLSTRPSEWASPSSSSEQPRVVTLVSTAESPFLRTQRAHALARESEGRRSGLAPTRSQPPTAASGLMSVASPTTTTRGVATTLTVTVSATRPRPTATVGTVSSQSSVAPAQPTLAASLCTPFQAPGEPRSFLYPAPLIEDFSRRWDRAALSASAHNWSALQLFLRFNVFAILLNASMILNLSLDRPPPAATCPRCADNSLGPHQCLAPPRFRGMICPRCGRVMRIRGAMETHIKACTGQSHRAWRTHLLSFRVDAEVTELKCKAGADDQGQGGCPWSSFVPAVHSCHALLHRALMRLRITDPTQLQLPPLYRWASGERFIPPPATLRRLYAAVRVLSDQYPFGIASLDLRYSTTIAHRRDIHNLDINIHLDVETMIERVRAIARPAGGSAPSRPPVPAPPRPSVPAPPRPSVPAPPRPSVPAPPQSLVPAPPQSLVPVPPQSSVSTPPQPSVSAPPQPSVSSAPEPSEAAPEVEVLAATVEETEVVDDRTDLAPGSSNKLTTTTQEETQQDTVVVSSDDDTTSNVTTASSKGEQTNESRPPTDVSSSQHFRIPKRISRSTARSYSPPSRRSVLRQRSPTPMHFDTTRTRHRGRSEKRSRTEADEESDARRHRGHAPSRRHSSSMGSAPKRRSPSPATPKEKVLVASVGTDAMVPVMPPEIAAASSAFEVDVFDDACAEVSSEEPLPGAAAIDAALTRARQLLQVRGPRRVAATSTVTRPTEHEVETTPASTTATSNITTAEMTSSSMLVSPPQGARHVMTGTATRSSGFVRVGASGSMGYPPVPTELMQGLTTPRPDFAGLMYGARTMEPIARVLIFGMTIPRGPVTLVSGTESEVGYFSAGPYNPRSHDANIKLENILAHVIVHQLQAAGAAWVREGEFALASTLRRQRRWIASGRVDAVTLVLLPYQVAYDSGELD